MAITRGVGTKIHKTVVMPDHPDIEIYIGDNVEIRQGVIFDMAVGGSIRIEKGCVIGAYNWFQASGTIFIGEQTISGPHVTWLSTRHQITFHENIKSMPLIKETLMIGKEVWVGASATLQSGIEVSKGVIIGANSFVNKDVESMTIVGGVPAKFIRKR